MHTAKRESIRHLTDYSSKEPPMFALADNEQKLFADQ